MSVTVCVLQWQLVVGWLGRDTLWICCQKVDETQGNVHSGARPPWLDTAAGVDGTVQSCPVIGPTADDLQKHCMLFDFVV